LPDAKEDSNKQHTKNIHVGLGYKIGLLLNFDFSNYTRLDAFSSAIVQSLNWIVN